MCLHQGVSIRQQRKEVQDVRVGEDYTCPTGILDCKLGLSVLAGDSTDSSGQVVAV